MSKNNSVRGIVYVDANHFEYGTFEETKDTIYIATEEEGVVPALPELKYSEHVTYSYKDGFYILKNRYDNNALLKHKLIFGTHRFPYKKFSREYGAFHNMNLFTKSVNQYLKSKIYDEHTLAKYLHYTFGVEFETSMGVVPEEECFNKGLIPLRDGSISGIEYSTVVLSGNNGLNLLKEQMDVLNKYTRFNKECAVHIHFGGFPVEPETLLALNNLCYFLANPLLKVCPSASFDTSQYKANRKNYCTQTSFYKDFNSFFRAMTDTSYFGSLYQPHPADPDKTRKWEIHSRYCMCNLVNMLCYEGPKTVEFRFLRPTHNIDVMYFWLYILNAILEYSKLCVGLTKDEFVALGYGISLETIIDSVYPPAIAIVLKKDIELMRIVRCNQDSNGDVCGRDIEFEDVFKLSDILINNGKFELFTQSIEGGANIPDQTPFSKRLKPETAESRKSVRRGQVKLNDLLEHYAKINPFEGLDPVEGVGFAWRP